MNGRKVKNADDLMEIMSEQLDVITSRNVKDEDLRASDAVANMIGKTLKLASLRIKYEEHIKSGGKKITQLEGDK